MLQLPDLPLKDICDKHSPSCFTSGIQESTHVFSNTSRCNKCTILNPGKLLYFIATTMATNYTLEVLCTLIQKFSKGVSKYKNGSPMASSI